MHESYLKRDISAAIKGVALICMFVHHFFTSPDWYVNGISYPFLSSIANYLYEPMKICLPLYAFLTGYFYFFSGKKTLRYSLRKITDLLVPHWVTCLFMMLIALALGVWHFSPAEFVLEMFGQGSSIMSFSWYVSFYCTAMLALPLVDRISSGRLGGDVLLTLLLPVVAALCLMVTIEEQFHLNLPLVTNLLYGFYTWFPCVSLGYLFARYSLFETYFEPLIQTFSPKAVAILCLGFFCIAMGGRLAMPRFRIGAIQAAGVWSELVFSMDLIYAPLAVFGIAKLLTVLNIASVTKVLSKLGMQSMYLWFLHALFFNVTKEITQPLIYAPKNPLLVLIFSLAVCYAISIPLSMIANPIVKWKNKYL